MGKRIEDFDRKWMLYADAGRAQAVSPVFFPDAASTAHSAVARWFSSKAGDPFPYAGAGDTMTPQAFSSWVVSHRVV